MTIPRSRCEFEEWTQHQANHEYTIDGALTNANLNALHLAVFNGSFHFWHQASTEVMSCWNRRWSLKDEIDLMNLVLSANK